MKKELPIALAAAVVILGICYGLATVRPSLPAGLSTPAATSATTTAPTGPQNDKVVMHVNGEPVTEREFIAFAQQAPDQMRDFYLSPDGRHQLAQEMVKYKALEQEGRRLGAEDDPEAKSRMDMAKTNILAAYALQKLVPKPNDARLRVEYEKEKKTLDTIQLSHILVAYQGGTLPAKGGAALSLAEAMKKAEAIEAQLRRGADFAQLARSQSDDVTSAAQGGNLGPVSPSALPPELQGPVASLKEQEISKPIKSSFGIHIFKSGAHQAKSFEEVKSMFAAKMQREEVEAAVTKLQKAAKVDFDPVFFPPQSAIPGQNAIPPQNAAPPRGRS